MRAAENGHLEVVKVLVQAGADSEKRNNVSICWLCRAMIVVVRFTMVTVLQSIFSGF
jgi:hypothetical protein